MSYMEMSWKLKLIIWILIIVVLGFFLVPFFGLLLTSFQRVAFMWWSGSFTLENYKNTLFRWPMSVELTRGFLNSCFITLASTTLTVMVSIFSAYALTKLRFKRRRETAFYFMLLYMFPGIIPVIPLYHFSQQTGLYDTHLFLILVYTFFNIPFATWLLRGFLKEVPKEIEEAAFVDGCSTLGVLFRVTIPLAKTGIAVSTIFLFIGTWNEFMMAAIFTDANYTLPVLVAKHVTHFYIDWGMLAAIVVIAVIPVLVLSFIVQKYIVAGLTMGAVKG